MDKEMLEYRKHILNASGVNGINITLGKTATG